MTPTPGMGDGLREFVHALGSRTPTPAGGAAAAAAVASGVALLLKVGRITHAGQETAEWKAVEERLEALVLRALDAVQADCDAFDGVLATKGRGEERRLAWVRATESPLELVHVASRALLAFAPFTNRVKKAVVADRSAGSELLLAGISISIENARANLTWIRESEDGERLTQEIHERRREAAEALSHFSLSLRPPVS